MDPLSFAWSSLSLFLTLSLSRTIDVFSALVSLTVNFRFSTQRQYQDLRRYPSLCRIMETFCYCCCSVSQSCPILCDPMDCSSQASLSFTISQSLLKPMSMDDGDAIQPSHPLLHPSPPALNLSQHQGPFQWTGSPHQVAKVLEFQLLYQSFQWLFRFDFL